MVNWMIIIMIGLACIFIPLVALALGSVIGAEWETVAVELTYPILIVFIIGVAFAFLFTYLRRN